MPLLLLILFLLLLYAPQMWAGYMLKRHARPRPHLEAGGTFARRLLDAHGLGRVRVEPTDLGDHYDPGEKAVRLRPEHFSQNSLTAVAVAAHEVGHALQDHTGYRPLQLRTHLVLLTRQMERIGALALALSPVALLLTRLPAAGLLFLLAGLGGLFAPVLVHAVTLPVEWDASFRRALPLLAPHLSRGEVRAARRILRACALTYLAASLASFLSLGGLMRALRR